MTMKAVAEEVLAAAQQPSAASDPASEAQPKAGPSSES
jgi:hypothetical protein